MATNVASPTSYSSRVEPNGNADNLGDVLRLEILRRDGTRNASVVIPIPQAILHSASFISPLAAVERHHIAPIFTVLFVEWCFLKIVGWSHKDVLSAIFFTSLLGRFAWPNLKRLHCKLDGIIEKIEALRQAIKSLESNTVVRPSTTYEVSIPEPLETPVVIGNPSPVVSQPHRDGGVQPEGLRDNIAEVTGAHPPVVPPVVVKDRPTVPPAVSQPRPGEGMNLEKLEDNIAKDARPSAIPPVVIKDPSPPPPPSTPSPNPVNGVSLEGWDNIMAAPEIGPEPVTFQVVNPSSSVLSAPLGYDHDGDVQLEGKIERTPHPDQPSISLSIPRWTMRLLMSAASLVPSSFASHSGFLGPVESTPYYPTGDLSRHRAIALSTAIECIEKLEAYIRGGDDVRIATNFVTLAQALSDLGLHGYALTISGLALNALQRPYTAEPNNARLHVASVLSLRANILCDLQKNEEANDAAERAVALCREHKNSHTVPVPELTHALLNHAVILNAIDLKDCSAAVAFELLSELDESQSEANDVLALSKLCVSTSRIGADNDMATSMADETIDSTRMSLDANSQAVLAAALLAKSKALSSKDQNDVASTVSAEAVTLLRGMSAVRPVFSLFLAHALDTHAHHLWGSNRKRESYSVRRDAVEHWQTLKAAAGGAVARPLAWSLFELAKFRHNDANRQVLSEEFRIAECAVEMFREAEPLDAPGLGDALYLYADRMLELDKNQEAATYAEESVMYFQEAALEDPKYALDLIFSLSLASACLACTEQGNVAFEYAKKAVEIQRGRLGAGDPQYDSHLRKLLMDVVFRAMEMDRPSDAAPWYEELQNLGGSDGPLARR